jgi:hypothetical protein
MSRSDRVAAHAAGIQACLWLRTWLSPPRACSPASWRSLCQRVWRDSRLTAMARWITCSTTAGPWHLRSCSTSRTVLPSPVLRRAWCDQAQDFVTQRLPAHCTRLSTVAEWHPSGAQSRAADKRFAWVRQAWHAALRTGRLLHRSRSGRPRRPAPASPS